MDEVDPRASRAAPGGVVQRLNPTLLQGPDCGVDVVDAVGKLLKTGPGPVEEPSDRRVGMQWGEQLDLGAGRVAADPEHRLVNSHLPVDFLVHDLHAEGAGVPRDGLVDVCDGDADMIDGREQSSHVGQARRQDQSGETGLHDGDDRSTLRTASSARCPGRGDTSGTARGNHKVHNVVPTPVSGVDTPREIMDKARDTLTARDMPDNGLSIFDGSPTGGFTTVVRGFDRVQVEQHVRQLEAALSQQRARTQELDKQIVRLRQELAQATTSLREVEQPSYSGLGARIEHLLRLAEEQASELVGQAEAEATEMRSVASVDAAEKRAAAEHDADEARSSAKRQADEQIEIARAEAEEARSAAQREASNLVEAAQREAAKVRAGIEHDAAEKRATAERDLTRFRTAAEREVTDMRATARREVEELRGNAKRDIEQMRAEAEARLDEVRTRADKELTELELALTGKREQAEREDSERHEVAVTKTHKLVTEAEARAADADNRAKSAHDRAEQVRREADEQAKALVSGARRNSDQLVAEAKAHSDMLLGEAKSEAVRIQTTARREVADLTRQRDAITGHLTQLRNLLGAMSLPSGESNGPPPAVEAGHSEDDVIDGEVVEDSHVEKAEK